MLHQRNAGEKRGGKSGTGGARKNAGKGKAKKKENLPPTTEESSDPEGDVVWTNAKTESLVSLWQEQPILFNSTAEGYFDKNKKQLIVATIAEKLSVTENDVTKKMKSMHSYFCQLRNQQRNVPSGASADDAAAKKISWQWFEPLQFLNENYVSDPTLCSIGGQDLDDLRSTIEKTNKRKRKNDDGSPSDALFARAVLAIEKDVNKPRGRASVAVAQVDTADELFGKTVALKMSRIPEGDEKEDLRIEIQQRINTVERSLRD